jgi:hypothetical protein
VALHCSTRLLYLSYPGKLETPQKMQAHPLRKAEPCLLRETRAPTPAKAELTPPYLDFAGAIPESSTVFVQIGKCLVIAALVATTGAHWALLQSVAWTTMLADNLRTHSLSESVARTFDGKYPCPICRAIAAGKKSEQKKEFTSPMQKLEFPPVAENFVLFAPSHFRLLPQVNFFSESLTQKPPTPPPRESFV